LIKNSFDSVESEFLAHPDFPKPKILDSPKPNPNLIFHFREKDQFQSASSINLPHPLVTSSLGTIGGNPLGTSLGTSSLHSQPSFEPFQPFKK